VVIGTVVVFVFASLALSSTKPKVYQATARLTYTPPPNVTNPSSGPSIDLNTLQFQLQSVGNLIGSPGLRTAAESNLSAKGATDTGYSLSALIVAPTSASNTALADSVDITVLGPSPVVAATVANAYATAVIELRKSAQQQGLEAAQHLVREQMAVFQSPQAKLSPDYAALSLQLRNLKLAEATATGDFVVLTPATASSSPISPKPVKSAIVAFSAGLFFGIAGAFVLGQFDIRARTYREVSQALGLTVIGRVPKMRRRDARGDFLVSLHDPGGAYSEALRVLRSNLDWCSIDDPLRLLLVSSCTKGEGKTVTLCNFGVTLARSGKKVVIVDADLRNPRVHLLFGLPNRSGLTSVALGTASLDENLWPIPRPGTKDASGASVDTSSWAGSLHILTSGPLPPNPGEVVASRSVADVLTALADRDIDIVLVDAPPLLGFGDAGALAPTVDGLLLIVNVTKARRPILEEGREILESLPCRKVGVVAVGGKIEATRYDRYSRDTSAGPRSRRGKASHRVRALSLAESLHLPASRSRRH
jgi:non-specific protein-tyrosine kinase